MILDEKKIKISESIEAAVLKKEEKEYKLLGSYIPKIDGGSIWEYNRETLELRKASFSNSENYVIGQTNNKKLDIEKNCIYVEALNENNAWKKIKKGKFIFSS